MDGVNKYTLPMTVTHNKSLKNEDALKCAP